LSAAYHLAKRGITDVVVVEKEFIGAGSSGRSASMIMLQMDGETKIKLCQYCMDRYMEFEGELGGDPEYDPIGTLLLADASVAEHARQQAELRQRLGAETHILAPEEINDYAPLVNVEDLEFGVWGPQDGGVEAQSIMLGYRDGARRLGGQVKQGVAATGIVVEGECVAAVETTEGRIDTPVVVNAAGADARAVAAWVGLDLPIDNRTRSIYVTAPFPQVADSHPFTYDVARQWYYRKEGPGVLIGMGVEKGRSAADAINTDLLPDVIDVAIHRVPALAEARIQSGWTGIRPLTPDNLPILGPVKGLDGYVNDCGWGGEGVMLAPVGGQLIAEFIADGATSTFALEPFQLARFG
jgi:sarcosine oxidase subunit beta